MAKSNTLDKEDGSISGVNSYSSLKKAPESNNESWDFRTIREHNFIKLLKSVARTAVVETEKASAANDALLSSFQELF